MSIHTPKIEKKVTLTTIAKMKGIEPITMVTAYDALFAQLFDGEVEMILVGDSLNMSFLGKEDTLSATMDQMIYHTQAVCNGAKLPLIVLDMPFGTYTSPEVAVQNATRAYQETNAQAVKIEGGKERAHIVEALTQNSIAVLGHIGLMPQFLRSDGGYKIRGKNQADIDTLVEDAKALAKNLGCNFEVIPISNLFASFQESLKPLFGDSPSNPLDLTEQNLQARIRGNLLMALSNKFGHLLLST